MTLLERVPAGVRRAIRKLTPPVLVEAVRRRALRPISMVSREPATTVWFRRHVLRQKPRLFHFEVHITDHCNLNCRGCAHFSNLCPPTFADPVEYETDMRNMSEHFSEVEQIYIMGGEPLLHPKVAEFVRITRRYSPTSRISLMTNGTLVLRQDEEFWAALRETDTVLLCDSYPIGLPVEKIDRLGVEHRVRVEWTEEREEFFKIPIDPEGGHVPADSFRSCQGFNNCPIIRNGRIYPCAYIAYADVFAGEFGLEGLQVSDRDSISIGPDVTGDQIMDFLSNPVPWCAHCNMESRDYYTWGRSKKSLDEWTCTPPETPAG